MIILLFTSSLFAQTEPPWCFDATPADFQASEDFENTHPQVASNLTTEISIPLYIIYVNDDNGTPPGKSYSLTHEVNLANEVYDGFLNFYICGYHHINSTEYHHLIPGTEKAGLYNTFHVDDAVNVYIVGSLDFGSAKTDWPWSIAPTNNIWMTPTVPAYTLAHELGHYFGLFHTFLLDYSGSGPTQCILKDPQTDIDMVPDTPYDPGRTSGICVQECPIATTPCTLTCYNPPFPVTYTYANYFTNNIMSYYNCPTQAFTTGQIDRMKYYLTHSNRSFLLTAQPTCNNIIAEKGYIRRVCTASAQNLSTPVRSIIVDMKNNTTNWEDEQNTNTEGRYQFFYNDFSNLVTVSLKPNKTHWNAPFVWVDPIAVPWNYHPTNGVSTKDITAINKHILGITALPAPYNWIAADVNNSGTITTFDLIFLRKVLLGLDYDYPAGTWRFVPEYLFNDSVFESDFMANPFTSNYNGIGYPAYLDQITLNMDNDAVAEEASWSFHGIKVGDVNCDAQIDQLIPPDDDDKFSVTLPGSLCVNTGEEIVVTIQAASIQSILAYQMGIKYAPSVLQFLGASPGNLPDFSYDNFGSKTGEIKTIWYKNNGLEESISTSKNLFNLRFKARVDFCDISQVLEFDDNLLNNVFYGSSEEPVQTDIALTYQVDNQATGTLLSAYPNPIVHNVSFDFQLAQLNTVEIRISDYLGHQLTHTGQYSSGSHSYTFNNLSSLSNGTLNYVLTIGNTVYSGILVKSQE